MSSPAWEDLGEFFQVADFAVQAQLRPGGNGTPRQVVGILDDPIDPAAAGGMISGRRRAEFEVDVPRPTFRAKLADVADVRRGDTLTIAGVIWDVLASPRSDGAGVATIDLAVRLA
jgi:hypothetical protein